MRGLWAAQTPSPYFPLFIKKEELNFCLACLFYLDFKLCKCKPGLSIFTKEISGASGVRRRILHWLYVKVTHGMCRWHFERGQAADCRVAELHYRQETCHMSGKVPSLMHDPNHFHSRVAATCFWSTVELHCLQPCLLGSQHVSFSRNASTNLYPVKFHFVTRNETVRW